MTMIFGHRGASAYAPENTLSAFRLAEEMGADGIGIDVQCCKDKEAVVLRDSFFHQVSGGRGCVWEYTLKELKAMDFGIGYSERFQGEQVASLDEVLDMISHSSMALSIELKSSPYCHDPALAERVYRSIKNFGTALKDKISLSSFDHQCLREYQKLDRDAKIGLLYNANLRCPGDYARLVGADAIHPYFMMIDEEGLDNCRELAVDVNVWTVDEPGDIRKMLRWRCDRIFTSKPDMAVQLRKEAGMDKQYLTPSAQVFTAVGKKLLAGVRTKG